MRATNVTARTIVVPTNRSGMPLVIESTHVPGMRVPGSWAPKIDSYSQ